MRRRNGWSGIGRRRHAAGPPWIGGRNDPLVRRWIGARRRRVARASPGTDGAGAEIITLTWAQTFGREADPGHRPPGPGAERRVVDLGEGRPGA
ncbi:hypothetical protein FF100_09450 [Methylobacterium terricola]|uniref:Uncharacterized protein n=1 Tax=Methylobacterium terricola TaxID=2583531 RepID=A0A5C4LJH8_9HYPH|nr:hypothetical protein [Methylobacterium terricola]TNC14381.1 hypothetical protein FF100_09450 [Methylobacterium terricola]